MKKKAARTRSPPFPHYPEWSEAKFWGYIRSGLRAKWSRWPPKFAVLKDARRKYIGENKLQKWEFQCSVCRCWHPQKAVEVDHIVGAGSLRCPEDLAGFVTRLFVGPLQLRVVCKPCHKVITKEQRSA